MSMVLEPIVFGAMLASRSLSSHNSTSKSAHRCHQPDSLTGSKPCHAANAASNSGLWPRFGQLTAGELADAVLKAFS